MAKKNRDSMENQPNQSNKSWLHLQNMPRQQKERWGGGGERNAVRFKLLQSKPKEGMKRIWDFPEM